MSFEFEKRAARHLLTMLEDGTRPIADIRVEAEQADPALVYLIFAWLRDRYHPGHSASEGVLGRIVALCQASSKVARMAREGEKDAICVWFEESYSYREMDREVFIDTVVEKLEG